MAIQEVITRVQVEFAWKRNGWIERFDLPHTTYQDALPVAANLALYRRSFLGHGAEITRCKVFFPGNPRESRVADIGYPIVNPFAHNVSGHLSEQFTGLHFRMETLQGRWANRILRGVSDGTIYGGYLDRQADVALPAGQVLTNPSNPNGTEERFRSSFLRYLLNETRLAVPVDVNGVRQWDVYQWDKVIFRRVAKRDTGRPVQVTRGRRYRRRAPEMPPA